MRWWFRTLCDRIVYKAGIFGKGSIWGSEIPSEIKSLLSKNTCLGCHKMDKKLIGPSFLAIAKRGYTDKELDAVDQGTGPGELVRLPTNGPNGVGRRQTTGSHGRLDCLLTKRIIFTPWI
jgi:hypothetical protein